MVLRDQGPLFARKDLKSILGDGLDVGEWIQLLNQRVYFFTDQPSMEKFMDKYVELDGAQDVIWLSPLKVLEAAGSRSSSRARTQALSPVEAVRRRRRTPSPRSWRFTDRKPTEATILGGLDDLSPVFRAERCFQDGLSRASDLAASGPPGRSPALTPT